MHKAREQYFLPEFSFIYTKNIELKYPIKGCDMKLIENCKSEYTKGNSTIIVERIYTEGRTLKDVIKEYMKQKTCSIWDCFN